MEPLARELVMVPCGELHPSEQNPNQGDVGAIVESIAALLEIDPGYCDVIARRFENLTGTKPTRDGVPHSFL